jgi:hypothetical protein
MMNLEGFGWAESLAASWKVLLLISCTDRVKNGEVLQRDKEERNIHIQ